MGRRQYSKGSSESSNPGKAILYDVFESGSEIATSGTGNTSFISDDNTIHSADDFLMVNKESVEKKKKKGWSRGVRGYT